MIELMIMYAMSFLGTPYVWGGNTFSGFDCSGFIQEVLASVGLDPKGDQTAQMLYDHLSQVDRKDIKFASQLGRGAIVFFGSSRHGGITHVGLMLDNEYMIEAGGGDQSTRTQDDARKSGACVRIRPVRKDLVAVIKPLKIGESNGSKKN